MLTIAHPNATHSAALNDTAQPPRLLDRMRSALRTRHYSYRTEQVYGDAVARKQAVALQRLIQQVESIIP
jgi:hypothetical protein